MPSLSNYLRARFSLPPRPFARHAAAWRLTGAFCVLWFTLVSVGVPSHATGAQACASVPGQTCRCSSEKRLSGTCCCRRESRPATQAASSCCAAKLVSVRPARPVPARVPPCCSKKLTAPSSPSPVPPSQRMTSIDACGCGSDASPGLVQIQEPRVSTAVAAVLWPTVADAWLALPCERFTGAPLQPPVPPPRLAVL